MKLPHSRFPFALITFRRLPVITSGILLLLATLALNSHAKENIRWDHQTLSVYLQSDTDALALLSQDSTLIAAILSSNSAERDQTMILRLDELWKHDPRSPAIQAVISQPVSAMLQQYIEKHPQYSELILTNIRGENVAVYPITTDYWQGDEAPWREVFSGRTAYIGTLEYDVSSSVNSVKVAVPVLQEDKIIGVLIASIKLSHIFNQQTRHPNLMGFFPVPAGFLPATISRLGCPC